MPCRPALAAASRAPSRSDQHASPQQLAALSPTHPAQQLAEIGAAPGCLWGSPLCNDATPSRYNASGQSKPQSSPPIAHVGETKHIYTRRQQKTCCAPADSQGGRSHQARASHQHSSVSARSPRRSSLFRNKVNALSLSGRVLRGAGASASTRSRSARPGGPPTAAQPAIRWQQADIALASLTYVQARPLPLTCNRTALACTPPSEFGAALASPGQPRLTNWPLGLPIHFCARSSLAIHNAYTIHIARTRNTGGGKYKLLRDVRAQRTQWYSQHNPQYNTVQTNGRVVLSHAACCARASGPLTLTLQRAPDWSL